jgi:hypothetical protein
MPKCPVCNNDVSILPKLLMMKRHFYCDKCGADLTVIPRSVALTSLVGVSVAALLGLLAGASKEKAPLLVMLAIWIMSFLLAYAKVAKLSIENKNKSSPEKKKDQ